MKYQRVATLGIVALVAASLVVGCGSTGSGSRIQLYLTDDPLDVQAVNVTISQVAVSKDGAGWIVLRDFGSSPITINLLDYRYDGNALTPDRYLLADSPLEEGHYTQIRLILTEIEIVDESGTHECEMNSQDKTGLKLIGEFEVAPGTKTAVLIDFNAAKSIVAMGNGGYRLQPTVKVVPLQISGSVHGIVVFKDTGGATVPVPAGATISAYQGATLAGSALINPDGSFGIGALVAGDYTLKLETPGFSAPDTPVSVAAGGDTDVGTITATAL
jgi:hypothetical protein